LPQEGQVNSLRFAPDGTHLIIVCDGVTLVDVATGKVIFKIGEFYARDVAISPNGSRLVSGGLFGNSVKMWDAASGRLIREFSGPPPNTVPVSGRLGEGLSPLAITSLAFSPDGGRIMAGTSDQELFNPNGAKDHAVNVWDAETGRLLTTFSGHSASITAVAFLPDGKRALSASQDNTIKMWDANQGTLLWTTAVEPAVSSFALSSDGEHLVSGSDRVQIWDVESRGPIRRFGSWEVESIDSASFSPTGRTIVSDSTKKGIRIWDLTIGELRRGARGGSFVKYLPDGKRLISSGEGLVQIWDVADGKLFKTFGGRPGSTDLMAVSHDGTKVLLGSKDDDKPLELWDIASEKLVRRFMTFSRVGAAAFSADDQEISAALGAVAKFWQTDSGKPIRAFTPFPNWGISSLAFLHNGKEMLFGGSVRASISDSSDLKLVDSSNGHTLQDFLGHSDTVSAVAISTDDALAVSGSWDGTVKLWELSSGKLLHTLVGSQAAINAVDLSPDGKLALSAGADGAVRIWNVQTGELLASMFELGNVDRQ
jgi:WD40 repeat protein